MVRMISQICAVLALFMCGCLQVSNAQDGPFPATVAGHVSSPNGHALPKAVVTLENANAHFTATTDATGSFIIAEVPLGTYNLQAHASNPKDFDKASLSNVVITGDAT